MKQLIASLALLGLVATPALATPVKSSKTITTTNKAGTVKATTTVTTKVTPVAKGKVKTHAKMHMNHSHATAAKANSAAKKTAASTKTAAPSAKKG